MDYFVRVCVCVLMKHTISWLVMVVKNGVAPMYVNVWLRAMQQQHYYHRRRQQYCSGKCVLGFQYNSNTGAENGTKKNNNNSKSLMLMSSSRFGVCRGV